MKNEYLCLKVVFTGAVKKSFIIKKIGLNLPNEILN